MPKTFDFDLDEEMERFFDDSSIPESHTQPTAVLIMGGVCSGKTTIRRQHYSEGYVLIDSAQVFLNLSGDRCYDFPDHFEEPMNLIGSMVAQQAISEGRNIVTELIGVIDVAATFGLVNALKDAGYYTQMVEVHCDAETACIRNENRGENNISAYYAEPIHRQWIIDACTSYLEGQSERGW
jgi:hypothetical protein